MAPTGVGVFGAVGQSHCFLLLLLLLLLPLLISPLTRFPGLLVSGPLGVPVSYSCSLSLLPTPYCPLGASGVPFIGFSSGPIAGALGAGAVGLPESAVGWMVLGRPRIG